MGKVIFFLIVFVSAVQGIDQHAESLEVQIKEAMKKIRLDEKGELSLWDAVDTVIAVKGPSPKGGCGGIDYNRIFLQMKRPVGQIIRDFRAVPALRPSGDKAGPHPGFDTSFESYTKRPRLQGHYRRTAPDESELQLIRERVGNAEVNWETLLEVDLDYNWLHGSNPLCRYKGILPSLLPGLLKGKTAEELFRSRWIDVPIVERVR